MSGAGTAPDDLIRGVVAGAPPVLVDAAAALSPVTGPTALACLTVPLGALAVARTRDPRWWALPAAVVVTHLVGHLLKWAVGRERPPGALLVEVAGHAFPSGHAAAGAALAGVLVLLARGGGRGRWALAGLAVAGAVASGVARLLLDVHWASDVLGGWLLGAGVAVITWKVTCRLTPGIRR